MKQTYRQVIQKATGENKSQNNQSVSSENKQKQNRPTGHQNNQQNGYQNNQQNRQTGHHGGHHGSHQNNGHHGGHQNNGQHNGHQHSGHQNNQHTGQKSYKPYNNSHNLTYKPTGERTVRFCKIIPSSMSSRGFSYKEGLNEDFREFNSDCCMSGGLHYCYEEDIAVWSWIGTLLAIVKIPVDAKFVESEDKLKANKLIIERIMPINQYVQERYPIIDGKYHPQIIAWLNDEPKFIEHINIQTENLCWYALKNNCYSIHYIKKRTEQMYDFAIEHDAHLIRLALADTTLSEHAKQKFQRMAIVDFAYGMRNLKNINVLKLLRNGLQKDMLEHLFKRDRDTIKHLTKDANHYLTAVTYNGLALKYIKQQSTEICTTAMKQNPACYKYVQSCFLVGDVKKMKDEYKKTLRKNSLQKTSLQSSISGVSTISTLSTLSDMSTTSRSSISGSSRSSKSSSKPSSKPSSKSSVSFKS